MQLRRNLKHIHQAGTTITQRGCLCVTTGKRKEALFWLRAMNVGIKLYTELAFPIALRAKRYERTPSLFPIAFALNPSLRQDLPLQSLLGSCTGSVATADARAPAAACFRTSVSILP